MRTNQSRAQGKDEQQEDFSSRLGSGESGPSGFKGLSSKRESKLKGERNKGQEGCSEGMRVHQGRV